MRAFERYHPIVLFCYYLSVVGFTMLLQNPVLLLISCLGAIGVSGILTSAKETAKSLLFILPMVLIVGITNPLFSHNGLTVLFYLNHTPITLESLCYGFMMGVMLSAVFYWFRSFQKLFSSEKVIYLFGKIAPSFALMLSMTLRIVPKAKRQAKKIHMAQLALKGSNDTTMIAKLKSAMERFSILITWLLENGVDTADSMRARGYGLKKRSQYHTYRFTKWDGILLGIIGLVSALLVVGYAFGELEFIYYPVISYSNSPSGAVYLFGFLFLSALPIILEGKEILQWRYLRSKM